MDDIVLFSTAEWTNPFWTNKQHTAVHLSKLGYRVLYIDTPGTRHLSLTVQDMMRISSRFKKIITGSSTAEDLVAVWTPTVIPFQKIRAIRALNKYLFSILLDQKLNQLSIKKDILWTYHPLTTCLVDLDQFNKVVYHCVDDLKVMPGMPYSLIEVEERRLVERADVVFATSPKLAETRKKWNPNTYYLPNVADFDHFSKAMHPDTAIPDDLCAIPSPRIGFIGAISGYKLDFELIVDLAKSHQDWSIVLIGKIGEGDPWTDVSLLNSVSNIFLTGPRAYRELPNYLKGMDVAILPNKINEYTGYMFPMKFFEYLSAGKPVVSVDLPALRDYRDLVMIGKTPEEFIRAVENALKGKVPPFEARIHVAKQHTYASRTRKMIEILHDVSRS